MQIGIGVGKMRSCDLVLEGARILAWLQRGPTGGERGAWLRPYPHGHFRSPLPCAFKPDPWLVVPRWPMRGPPDQNLQIVQLLNDPMMSAYSTITVRQEVKDRLALLKGSRSWDDFLTEVAESLPSDGAIAEMERRLKELRTGRVQAIPWSEAKRELATKRKRR